MQYTHNDDPVQCYLNYLRKGAGKHRRTASKAEGVRRVIADASSVANAPPGPVGQQSGAPGTVPQTTATVTVDIDKLKEAVRGKRLIIGTGQVFSD
ncbi:hypothetical protein ACXX82_00175 [Glaciimonas sp. GNP009]